jgi:glycosyltransferase involved in cell wall biosynthesis
MALNILYHHRTQGRGAEGVHITSIVRALEAMGHTVTIVSPPGVDPLNPANSAPVDKSRVKTGGMQTVWKWISRHLPNALFELAEIAYNFAAYMRLRRVLAGQHFDLIYERYAFYLLAGAMLARKHGIPFVLEANEVSGIANRARPQSYPRLCARFERMLFRNCTAIHTVSSELKRMILKQGVQADRVHVVPNALDVDKVSPRAKSAVLLDQYDLAGKFLLGFAGWFDEWDRLDFFVDVFRRLRTHHTDLRLILIGDGPVVVAVKRKIADYGLQQDVVFTGPVPRAQIYDYLSLMDIAVLPHSNNFGSPVVMFEFMGLKIPLVAPRLPPIEDVHADGVTALLFDPLDVETCARAIDRFIESPELREKISGSALLKLRNDHTWKQNAALILHSAHLS